jgi:hypothetical protein
LWGRQMNEKELLEKLFKRIELSKTFLLSRKIFVDHYYELVSISGDDGLYSSDDGEILKSTCTGVDLIDSNSKVVLARITEKSLRSVLVAKVDQIKKSKIDGL